MAGVKHGDEVIIPPIALSLLQTRFHLGAMPPRHRKNSLSLCSLFRKRLEEISIKKMASLTIKKQKKNYSNSSHVFEPANLEFI